MSAANSARLVENSRGVAAHGPSPVVPDDTAVTAGWASISASDASYPW